MSRIRTHLGSIPKFDSAICKAGILGIYITCLPVFIVIALGIPTGLGIYIDIPVISLLGLVVLFFSNLLLSFLVTFMKLPIPNLLIGSFIAAFAVITIALTNSNISYWACAILSALLLSIGFLISVFLFIMMKPTISRFHHYCYMGCCIVLLLLSFLWLYDKLPFRTPSYEKLFVYDDIERTIEAEDPGLIGSYSYESLTYGSGVDRHRDEFGKDVDMITRTVDGSEWIERWSPVRKLFWGFDQTNLPLNGRVWLPEGEGPFPLVLIVHGNHLMEDFSDDGYAYLGQLLASKGFIMVSLDENFINYSVWSGGLSNDMELRSWIVLQHIEEIRELNSLTSNPLSSKVDMSRIALIGHSRGGQAVVRAVEKSDIQDDVKAIVAIAPTDMKDEAYLTLDHTNYMVIQGAQDADVSTFTGDRQYERTSVSSPSDIFKTSLYISGANHGQFNTGWGLQDLSLPAGFLLNTKDIIDGEDQRKIAKTYVAAFLETTLMNSTVYLPMFQDYREAAHWLPATSYRNRFESSSFISISDFEEDQDIRTTSIHNGSIQATELDGWEEITVKDRQESSKQNRSVQLTWSDQLGSFELNIPSQGWIKKLTPESIFSFSLANLTDKANLDFMIEMETMDGVKVHSPISHFQRIQPAIHSRFTKERFLDVAVRKGRYGASMEPVFQTYMIPLHKLVNDKIDFNIKEIRSIRFLFQHEEDGHILLDDIGIY